jgi:hypothetical protein
VVDGTERYAGFVDDSGDRRLLRILRWPSLARRRRARARATFTPRRFGVTDPRWSLMRPRLLALVQIFVVDIPITVL